MNNDTALPSANYGKRLIPTLIDELATNDAERVFVSIPRTANIEDGFHDITFADLARAIDNCAWWMERTLQRSETFETLNYVGPQDLRYLILLIAGIKTGYKLFFSSPWNSAEGHIALLDSLQCNKILVPETLPPIIQTILSRKQLDTVPIPNLRDLFAPNPVPVYPYTKTFAQARFDPFVVLHTSGSTGFPKPVILTHGTMAQHDTFLQPRKEGERPLALACYRGLRVFIGLSLFHSAAMCLIAYAIYSDTILVLPSPLGPVPMTAEALNLIHLHGRLDVSFASPALLVGIAKNKGYLENIRRLRYLSFGGGPLPRETGNVLRSYTRLFVNFGATETGYLALHLNDPEDWEYMSFSDQMGCELRTFTEGLYELHFIRDSKLEASQGIFSTFPALSEYSTKDLFSKHPTKEGLWLFEGRSDDVIVCSTGQKINPLPIEGLLNAHPSIISANVCGQSRFQISLLVEAKHPPKDKDSRLALVRDIWPTIERANQDQPGVGRITKDMILFTKADKPMTRAGKGTVLRKMTEELYRQELDEMYNAFKEGNWQCAQPAVRREWRSLAPADKSQYIEAVQCLESKPSRVRNNGTLYDDFPWVHKSTSINTHGASSFLPWHRYFIHIYEKALIDDCAYTGTLPYWDWSLDWQDFTKAPVWGEDAFGSDGQLDGEPSVGDGHCVIDGPFAGLQAMFYDDEYYPHCFSRGFQSGSIKETLGKLVQPEVIARIMEEERFESFALQLEHNAHHFMSESVRGEFSKFTGPYDPVFFLHHTNLDRLWWQWQMKKPETNLQAYNGKANKNEIRAASLGDDLDLGGLRRNIFVSEVMDTTSGLFCYRQVLMTGRRSMVRGRRPFARPVKAKDNDKGVNTGVGASADTRTDAVYGLQQTIIRQFHSGILVSPTTRALAAKSHIKSKAGSDHVSTANALQKLLLLDDPVAATCMPASWARASILIRTNSLARGHSSVRPVLIQRLIDLLRLEITPMIPLRGSISASGDLMPLAYIGGALQGRPGTLVWAPEVDRSIGGRRVVTAEVALAQALLEPIILGPKEGLAVVNGTSVSAGTAALAMHDANCLAVACQVLTAMSTEALKGTEESFDSFFARVRPHPGQIESSFNIANFLAGSKLIRRHGDDDREGALYQDRYSIRTAPQWIGPILEDFLLATRQITIECNSTTDNPLFDTGSGRLLCGGNFQAKSITSAMEKMRLGLQSIGQMLFAQCTELMNPKLNNGLPPNLVADQPSQSFLMKPLDVAIASFQSELGFLSNPAGTHINSAEMGNQSLNSLALISVRYSHIAVDVLSHLCAVHAFALCQALDLRAMQIKFLDALEPIFRSETAKMLAIFGEQVNVEAEHTHLWSQLIKCLDETTTKDSATRFPAVFESLQPSILALDSIIGDPSTKVVGPLREWTRSCSDMALKAFHANTESYAARPDAAPFLGKASTRIYDMIRHELSVPFIQGDEAMTGEVSIGSYITSIYEAIRNGVFFLSVIECLEEVSQNRDTIYTYPSKL
ncbi:hypothetical protein G7Y89_g45 [Cudoniella acicularis]|uniref:Tyrosinase copper-binding domain-containing protein n=1 Tax=Cudoniella acicularis TaxID=354080 RepID=A0A8H4W8N5_9HELO|nr:hypothetical protein G7Y89_g45 [Cudoniella acicularis]